MRTYEKTTKSGRVKLEFRLPWSDHNYDIYAKREQLDPYFGKYNNFRLHQFLAHLDSYRTCGFVAHSPLDNVRAVKLAKPDLTDDSTVEIVNRLNRLRDEEKEKRRNRAKAYGWQVHPTP